MEQLKSIADLLDLQEIDLQIDRLLDTRGSLPELDEYKVVHQSVDTLQSDLESEEAVLKGVSMALRKANGELEIAAEKASSEQNRLYAGGLSARDADYLRREVELLYGKVSSLEDDVLEYMEQKETSETRVEELTVEHAGAASEKQRLADSVQEQWRLIDKELAIKEDRKVTAVALVDEDLLETYDGMRERREGRVVGRLSDGICGACHLGLSAAEVAEVTREDPPRCIHCRSILVV